MVLAWLISVSASSSAMGQDPATRPNPAPLLALPDLRIDRSEYLEHLYQCLGGARLEELVLDRLLARAVAKLDLGDLPSTTTVTLTDPAQAAQRSMEQQVAKDWNGDRERWRQSLAASGVTPSEFLAAQQLTELREARIAALVQSQRQPEEAALRRLFDQHYGVDGQRVTLRHCLISYHKIQHELEARRGRSPATRTEIERIAKERAEQLWQKLGTGVRLEDLVLQSDDPRGQQGGQIPDYNYQEFGIELATAVRAMQVGERKLVQSSHGWHIVQLDGRVVTAFETVREALWQRWREQPPSLAERQRLVERLLRDSGAKAALQR